MVERTVWRNDGTLLSYHASYGSSSLARQRASAAMLNVLHYCPDKTLGEDQQRQKCGQAGQTLAIMNNMVVSLVGERSLAAAQREVHSFGEDVGIMKTIKAEYVHLVVAISFANGSVADILYHVVVAASGRNQSRPIVGGEPWLYGVLAGYGLARAAHWTLCFLPLSVTCPSTSILVFPFPKHGIIVLFQQVLCGDHAVVGEFHSLGNHYLIVVAQHTEVTGMQQVAGLGVFNCFSEPPLTASAKSRTSANPC